MRHMISRRWLAAIVACALIACLAPSAQAIEVAGELFVDLNAATFKTGDPTWANPGSYVDFEAVGTPTGGFIETTPAVFFDGASAFFGVDNDPAPEGLTGFNPTRSIEVWALNPDILQEETMVSWGHRGGPDGTNMSFNYGFRGEWGAVGHWGGPDLGWIDNNWSAGAPAANKWHHLVYTYDGTTTRVYSDGELWNEENVVEDLGVDLNTYDLPAIAIASQWTNDIDLEPGIRGSMAIGRVRIHDGVLTSAQILSNYNQEKASFINPGGGGELTPETLTAGPAHRYSFSGNADDSVGGANGVLVNNTTAAKYQDGALVLGNNGSQASNADNGDYVDLPNGLVSGLGKNATFETWTTWGGPVPGWWQRIFDFGTSDGGEDVSPEAPNSTYTFLTPYGGDTSLRFGYRWGPEANERIIQDVASLEVGKEQHVAVVWNGDAGTAQLFVDGELVASNTLHFDLEEMDDNNNWLGRSQWNDAMYVGSYDEFRLYNYALSANQVYGNFLAGADTVNTGGGLKGDYNKNGSLDAGDLDLQAIQIDSGANNAAFDLTGDGKVDLDDRLYWVENPTMKNSWLGDADLNGVFNSDDFVLAFQAGKYEVDGATATWEQGDWNGDLLFTSGDFVSAFASGGYEVGPRAAVAAVPEPAGMALLLMGALAVLGLRRRA